MYHQIHSTMEIQTDIVIEAAPQKVWEIFTDFAAYPSWNPFIFSLTGPVATGNIIKVKLPGMNFTPTVLAYQQNKVFTWQGKLLFTGLFDGTHSFKLTDLQNGKTRFEQSEKFSGFLLPIFRKMLNTKTRDGFVAMNKRLKTRVEHLVI